MTAHYALTQSALTAQSRQEYVLNALVSSETSLILANAYPATMTASLHSTLDHIIVKFARTASAGHVR
jgi:hypothetical protein